MGYDMFIAQERDQAEKDAKAHIDTLASPLYLPEGEEREVAREVHKEAWDAYDKADRSCFRLDNFGMDRYRDLMAKLGMLTAEEPPAFPSPRITG